MKWRCLLSATAALGATTICCLWIVGPLVSPSHDMIYHWSGPASALFLPSVLDFFFVWIFFAVLLFASQGASRGSATIWAAVMLFLPAATLKSLSLFMSWHPANWIGLGLLSLCAASFAFFVLFDPFPPTVLVELRRLTINLLSVVALSGALVLVQLAWFGWHARGINAPQPLHQATRATVQTASAHPRVIWILFDELSYQQVYGQRFHTLNLPAFDQLAQESTIFTNVVPAGVMTDLVMPSLIAGLPVDHIQPSLSGNSFKFRNPLTQRWQAFDPRDTVFGDALNAGYNTAIAGWYNPYCRILPQVLDRCFWTFDELTQSKMVPGASLVRNILNPLLLSPSVVDHLPYAITHGIKTEDWVAKMHLSDYRRIVQASDQMLKDPSIDFILIHMAVPHPVGIYDRATGSFATRNSTYLDNLALADSYLAHVRSLLESTGRWDSSAVVVMGDHSWRTKMIWSETPDWTAEEQLASNGGHFDDRPAYIVKLPEQKEENNVNLPFDAVDTRILFNKIMKRRIVSPQDLSSWVRSLDARTSQNESASSTEVPRK